jgi:hypothetical protein
MERECKNLEFGKEVLSETFYLSDKLYVHHGSAVILLNGSSFDAWSVMTRTPDVVAIYLGELM